MRLVLSNVRLQQQSGPYPLPDPANFGILRSSPVAAAGAPLQYRPSLQATASGSARPASQQSGQSNLPNSWDEIGAGHVVIAFDEPGEGWYEAIVVETSGDMLTMRWRDYPRERRFSRHRISVGLLYPHGLPATDPNAAPLGSKTAKPKHSAT